MAQYKKLIDLSTLKRNPKAGQLIAPTTIYFGKYLTGYEFLKMIHSGAFETDKDLSHHIKAVSEDLDRMWWVSGVYEGYRDGDYSRPYGGFVNHMIPAEFAPDHMPYEKIEVSIQPVFSIGSYTPIVPVEDDWLPYKYQKMTVPCGNCGKKIDPDELEIINYHDEDGFESGYDEVCPKCGQDPKFIILNETVDEALDRAKREGIFLDISPDIEEDRLRLVRHSED